MLEVFRPEFFRPGDVAARFHEHAIAPVVYGAWELGHTTACAFVTSKIKKLYFASIFLSATRHSKFA